MSLQKQIFVKRLPANKFNGYDLRLYNAVNKGYQLATRYNSQFIIDYPGLSIRQVFKLRLARESLLVLQDNDLRMRSQILKNRLSMHSLFLYVRVLLRTYFHHIYFLKVGYISEEDFFLPRYFTNNQLIYHVPRLEKYFDPLQLEFPVRFHFWGNGGYYPNQLSLEATNNAGLDYSDISFWGKGYEGNSALIKGFIESLESLRTPGNWAFFPIIVGTGIKNKVLEAVLLGMPIIGTKLAFDGIPEFASYKGSFDSINKLYQFLRTMKKEELAGIYNDYLKCRSTCLLRLEEYRGLKYLYNE